jgi:hypothetical protein
MSIVTVTWSVDPNAGDYETFGDTIGASAYWHTLNSEYGVGPATSGATSHVRLATAPPAQMTDDDIQNLLSGALTSSSSGWPAPTAQTLYAIYLSPMTGLESEGVDACLVLRGYHAEAMIGGQSVVYAVLPHCPGSEPADVMAYASHELNEAATDPARWETRA